MKSVIALTISLNAGYSLAQPVISESKFFCKTDQFLSRTGKVKAADLKKCGSLLENAETAVKNTEECRTRAMEKGEACLKRLNGAEQISVKMKLTEKFGQNANLNSFTCEIDKNGGTACP